MKLAVGAAAEDEAIPEYTGSIPGEIVATAFGLRLRVEIAAAAEGQAAAGMSATVRNWKPGDRVRLRYSGGERKVKEVLERLRVTGAGRAVWPVLDVAGHIVWMKGVELEPAGEIEVVAASLEETDHGASVAGRAHSEASGTG